VATQARKIPYMFGIRGISAIYVTLFHLNNMIVQANPAGIPALYHRLTDWIRYGDFRVAAFFVMSGYLLTVPIARSAQWKLPAGERGFLRRRAERLLGPYYVALALSVLLFLIWSAVAQVPVHLKAFSIGLAAHVLLIHNLDPRTMLYISDPLWNVALEFQCYVLFALVLLPAMRRFGVWRPLVAVSVLSLAPHFLFHGWLDWVRPWFVILYALGVATCALANPAFPELQRQEDRIPWGTIWFAATLATPVAVWASGIDAPYGAGWLQNLLLGLAVSAFFLYVRRGTPGPFAKPAKVAVRALEFRPLCALGAFSYSVYLVHFPILRLLVALTGLYTHSTWILAGLSFFVFVPLTVWIAYGFHVLVERRFQQGRIWPATRVIAPVPLEASALAPET